MRRLTTHRMRGVLVVAAASVLCGCQSIGGFVGAASGIAAGTVSSNPAVGIGVGIAVQAATDTVVATVFRNMQRGEQDRIALIAATSPIGARQPWSIHHTIPFNDEHGELEVVADIDNALAPCRMVMFSVIGGKKNAPTENWYATQTCRQSDGQWKWAAAEPAVSRWGNLQ
jgi:hypothetical protein